MNHLGENVNSFTNFAEQLRAIRDTQDAGAVSIPDLQQWMQYWNDEESDAANLRNIRHWISRAPTNS